MTRVLSMDDSERGLVQVRPFAERDEYERMIDYFLTADDAALAAMGVDRSRFPSREEWLAAVVLDHARPREQKERGYLAWVYDGVVIGHSSINKIRFGEDAFIHLHLWERVRRRGGLGTVFFRLSAESFSRDFKLRRLYCEPYADNPAPNHVLPH